MAPGATTAPGPSTANGTQPEQEKARADKQKKRSSLTDVVRRALGTRWTLLGSEEQARRERLFQGIELAVDRSADNEVHEAGLGTHVHEAGWLRDLFDGETLDKLFATEHMGNFVIVRATGEKVFEPMPIYARIGMHLLFYGPAQLRFLQWRRIRTILKDVSVRQGRIYDSTDPQTVQRQINSFVKTYNINLKELLEPNLKKYKTFNDFFSRKLKPNARPPTSPKDLSVIVSAADSRLTVFSSFSAAKKLWVKGKHFTLPALLQDPALVHALGPEPSLAVFRLAPQDYHRFHAPVRAEVKSVRAIPGEYYTVNPQAVNERLDVFTANTRSVMWAEADLSSEGSKEEGKGKVPAAIVAVGALLVGSIVWEKQEAGAKFDKGDGAGYFRYGGSTVIVLFPKSSGVQWDEDLMKTSESGLEMVVRAGERIGKATTS